MLIKNPNKNVWVFSVILKPLKPTKMKIYFFTIILLFSSFSLIAQEVNTIENQFDEVYRISTNYKAYKVINKSRFIKLKTNVLDSLNLAKEKNIEKDNLLKVKDNAIENIQEKTNTIQLELDTLHEKENTISLLGIRIQKRTYSIIVWSIIGFLLIGILYFSYRFISSNKLTKEAKSNLATLEEEFELHKKKSLVNEQKLRRQLQDEINKQKSV